ncbi:hypothetical protein F0919_17875 [Taibaiella lutea]|uniref:Phage major capsid protein n=1 Tax=Taibaiella lutea TaxID=2608001 RepID=A0A5M6CDW4_9BACT|nr:hypothetical protein [Taibaiella lutea]KAA5532650.1 hypothetical protein F0919_17875 [Taibaiella lutea]
MTILQPFSISSLQFHESIIIPAFQDLVPETMPFTGTLGEFTLMDNVISKRDIIEIRRMKNILQRRDASCDLNYKKVAGTTNRRITVDELYAAAKHCKNEFYTGCLKDWRNQDPLFGNKILPWFRQAVMTDVASNAYFGDIERIDSPSEWSTNKYDGIFKWIAAYYAAGAIPENQGFSIPVRDLRTSPQTAVNVLQNLYDNQHPLMRSLPPAEKYFTVTQSVLDGYRKWLKNTGQADTIIANYANGVSISTFEGIPILVEPLWEPIMAEVYGGPNRNAAILTVRGNFVYGTDKTYGEMDGETGNGPDSTSLMVWYEKKDLSWYFQMFLKAGTQIALPEYVSFAVPEQ